ncbi:solute carrier family 2, facilitated glucose transporter member 5-like isoform X1 [Varanus komodoensis]|uniref:solute carrier family 2, facilitated glucose transporter member 5-like isoform X1 n=1 Tax=Varanus komodoensis TaxID=61221 RepID=UPI001CF7C69B|nr:solute carrier family 2, facilitated glucose transporter member 5-like isoform X1 [Varanus komodoensis]
MFMASANVVHGTLFALFSRLLIGITIGIFSSAVPLYLGEISPIKMRGVIGMMPHLFLTIGVQVAQILAFREIMGTAEGWPILMSLSGILALFQIIIVPSFPESPRYLLIQKKDENQAREALQELRDKNDVEDEMEEIRQEGFAERADRNMNSLRLLCYPPLRWQVVSIIVLMCGQQLSGVNAIYFYTERIYQSMGLAKDAVRYISLFSTTAILLAIMCGMYVIETMGRKKLLLIGFGTCSFLCLLLSVTIKLQTTFKWISYFNSLFINIFLIGHAMGPSALPNLLITELFLQSSRSSAYVVGGFIHWLLNFFTVVTFILIQPFLESYTFLICSPICMITFLYSFQMIPETKGKTFLEISRLVPAFVARRMWVKVQPNE